MIIVYNILETMFFTLAYTYNDKVEYIKYVHCADNVTIIANLHSVSK